MGGCSIIGFENINGDDPLYSSMISEDKKPTQKTDRVPMSAQHSDETGVLLAGSARRGA